MQYLFVVLGCESEQYFKNLTNKISSVADRGVTKEGCGVLHPHPQKFSKCCLSGKFCGPSEKKKRNYLLQLIYSTENMFYLGLFGFAEMSGNFLIAFNLSELLYAGNIALYSFNQRPNPSQI